MLRLLNKVSILYIYFKFFNNNNNSDQLTILKITLYELKQNYLSYKSGEFGEPDEDMLESMKQEIRETTTDMFNLAKRQRQSLQISSSSSSSSSHSTPLVTIHFKGNG